MRFLFVVLAILFTTLHVGCGPSEQEVSLRQLDSDAANIINDLITLYESTKTENDADKNLDRLFILHDQWLENRKTAYELDLAGEVFDRSWAPYRQDQKMFDFRFRLHKNSIQRRAKLFKDFSVVRKLEPFHQKMYNDWSLVPARHRIASS